MPLGIRLDRPSAVGDEGRPRGTSLTITGLIVVGALVAAGFLAGQPLIFTSFALLVGLVTAGFALLQRDRLGPTVLGHLCFLPAAVVLSLVVTVAGLLSFRQPGMFFVVAGGLVAMFGVTAGWNDTFETEIIKHALVSSAISYVFWLGTLVVLFILALLWVGVSELVGVLADGAGPTTSLFGLLGLVGIAAACLYAAVRAVPAIQLTPAHERAAARERYKLLKRRVLVVTIAAWGLLTLLAAWLLTGTMTPVLQALAAPLRITASVLAIPLAVVAAISVLIAVGSWATKRATAGFNSASTRSVGAAIAAVSYTVALIVAIPLLIYLALFGGPLVIGVFIAPLFVYVVLLGILGLLYVGLVPERAGPSALAAAGLISLAIGGGMVGFPSVFIFATVAGGLVAWDMGTYGLGLTAELGHIPATRRLELYHGVVAVGLALVGIALLTGLDIARRSVGAGISAPAAMGIAVVGVALLLLPLRG